MNRDHPHLTADVLHRDTYAFATGGWWQSSTLRTLSGSRWPMSDLLDMLSLSMGSRFGGRQQDIIRYSPDCLEGLFSEVLSISTLL